MTAMERPAPPQERFNTRRWVAEVENAEWWRLAPPDTRCTQPRCGRTAVMQLQRTRSAPSRSASFGTSVRYWWSCCDYLNHTYGRWIEGGQVWHWRLVEDHAEAATS